MEFTDYSLLLQIILLLLIIFGYIAYLYTVRRKILRQQNEKKIMSSSFSGSISTALNKKLEEKLLQHTIDANRIIDQSDEQMTYSIVLPQDIEILETGTCLLIKGPVESIDIICCEFASMEQLPEGYCVILGDWKLFVLEDFPQSSREDKIFVMPANHWLFMSSKLRESITGHEIHPYNYIYEPFTFRKIFEYGIGVEAINYTEFNNERI